MKTIRTRRDQPFEVTNCPACGAKHSFNLAVVIDSEVGGMFMMTMRVETMACSLTCPNKNATIMVDVPLTLISGESLISVR